MNLVLSLRGETGNKLYQTQQQIHGYMSKEEQTLDLLLYFLFVPTSTPPGFGAETTE